MLRAVAIAGLLALAPFAGRAGADVIMTEDFETDGDGSRYIQSHSVTSNGYYDEAKDGTTINNGDSENIERFSGVNGSYYFLHEFGGAVDSPDAITLTFDNVDVSLYEDLELDILLGGGSKMDFNEEERLRILVREDNSGDDSSAYTVIDTFSYTGTTGNGGNASNGSGVTLDLTLQNVNYDLSSFDSASMIDIQIETIGTSNNNHKELFAFDNVRLSGIPEPATMSLLALGGLAMLKRRRRA
jgi:hypothetical protein